MRRFGELEVVIMDRLWEQGRPMLVREMVEDLRALVATIQKPALRQLLETLFAEDSEVWRRWSTAPAAKKYHQAYRHGLLEHCLSVAQGVNAVSATFPGIDRDVAVTGALLHDIGKITVPATGTLNAKVNATSNALDAGKMSVTVTATFTSASKATGKITYSQDQSGATCGPRTVKFAVSTNAPTSLG